MGKGVGQKKKKVIRAFCEFPVYIFFLKLECFDGLKSLAYFNKISILDNPMRVDSLFVAFFYFIYLNQKAIALGELN